MLTINLQYSAFVIYLNDNEAGTVMSASKLAECLLEQDEVKEFVPQVIDPNQLHCTVTFATRLAIIWSEFSGEGLQKRHESPGNLAADLGDSFLIIWETYVYPVLKAKENEPWSEMWRGGHITNDIV